jgi:Flp pilus assembly protein TadG
MPDRAALKSRAPASRGRRASLSSCARRRRREGSVAILVAFSLVVLIGFTAMAVDASHLYKVRNELQAGADASALAAAFHINGEASGITAANTAAKTLSASNDAYNSSVEVLDADIQPGFWDLETETFDPSVTNPTLQNAVQVTTHRNSTHGAPVFGPFASIFGQSQTDVSASAIAVAGGVGLACGFPMVVGECAVNSELGTEDCGYCFTEINNNDDTSGWTIFGGNDINSNTVGALIAAACFSDPATANSPSVDPTTRECTGGCTTSYFGDEIPINNGAGILNPGNGPVTGNPCELIKRILERDGAPKYFTVQVPVIGADDCPNVDFVNDQFIEGYAAIDIWGVQCSNSEDPVIDETHPDFGESGPCGETPNDRFILGSLNCDYEPDGPIGGTNTGNATARRVRLVD